jgi:hypothetical protein
MECGKKGREEGKESAPEVRRNAEKVRIEGIGLDYQCHQWIAGKLTDPNMSLLSPARQIESCLGDVGLGEHGSTGNDLGRSFADPAM